MLRLLTLPYNKLLQLCDFNLTKTWKQEIVTYNTFFLFFI